MIIQTNLEYLYTFTDLGKKRPNYIVYRKNLNCSTIINFSRRSYCKNFSKLENQKLLDEKNPCSDEYVEFYEKLIKLCESPERTQKDPCSMEYVQLYSEILNFCKNGNVNVYKKSIITYNNYLREIKIYYKTPSNEVPPLDHYEREILNINEFFNVLDKWFAMAYIWGPIIIIIFMFLIIIKYLFKKF
jgi:hypothetical protein